MATQTITTGSTTFGAPNGGDTYFVLEGGQAITGNTDSSGVTACVTAEISRGFSGSIGTSAAPWKAAFSTRIVHSGSGVLSWESNSSDTETTALAQNIGGGTMDCYGAAAIITRLEQINGRTTVANASTVTTARNGGGSMYLWDTGTAPAVTTLDVIGGYVTSQRPHTTANLMSGTLMLLADDAGAVNAHTTINIYGGTLVLRDLGTVTNFNWYGGNVDASKLTRTVTFTNSTINCSIPGASNLLDHPLITFSSNTRIMSDGRQLN